MKPNENDIDLIERFLDGTLNEEELASFHSRVKEDPDFAGLVELRKEIQDLWIAANAYQEIEEEVRRSLKRSTSKSLFQLKTLFPTSHQRILWMPPVVFAIAASLVVLIGIALALTLTKGGGKGLNEGDQTIVTQRDSILPLKSDNPEFKARLGNVTKDSLSGFHLLFPIDGQAYHSADSITFIWSMPCDSATTFYITDQLSGKIVLQKAIEPEKTEFILPPNSLKSGTYSWFIGTEQVKREIQIVPLRSP